MRDTFEIQGYTIPNTGREKNGDCYGFEYIESEGLLLAVVADGVSRQPCDWLASETTCKHLLEIFKKSAEQSDMGTRLRESIFKTNQKLIDAEGPCQKMASTLSVVVLDSDQKRFYYSNIGDSRIYRLDRGIFLQLTRDDSVVTKEKVYISGMVRTIDKHTLTKAMGQKNISIEVVEEPINEGQIIILATDGFYEARKASFNRIMEQFETSNSFEENFKTTLDKVEILRGDDLTVVMIKKK
jgi:serine/threonine protein phosphatase PrpC